MSRIHRGNGCPEISDHDRTIHERRRKEAEEMAGDQEVRASHEPETVALMWKIGRVQLGPDTGKPAYYAPGGQRDLGRRPILGHQGRAAGRLPRAARLQGLTTQLPADFGPGLDHEGEHQHGHRDRPRAARLALCPFREVFPHLVFKVIQGFAPENDRRAGALTTHVVQAGDSAPPVPAAGDVVQAVRVGHGVSLGHFG